VTGARAFAESLKRHREVRGITLRDVAEQTKIGSAFLVALERGDCSKWPGGIYSRAWIRAYAAAIGLDPDEVCARFTRCFAANAFPDGESEPAVAPRPPGLPQVTPLRLTLEPDRRERSRLLQRRALFLSTDLVLAAAIAVIASTLAPLDFWKVLAGAVATCHAVGLFGGGGSFTGWLERRARRHARSLDDHAGESAVAEAA
jgi:cytoskeletal protein RodZ